MIYAVSNVPGHGSKTLPYGVKAEENYRCPPGAGAKYEKILVDPDAKNSNRGRRSTSPCPGSISVHYQCTSASLLSTSPEATRAEPLGHLTKARRDREDRGQGDRSVQAAGSLSSQNRGR